MSKLADYLRDTRGELRHVSWPTKNQAIAFTAIVIALALFMALFLGFFDFLFTWLLEISIR
jgi:preprotein translocase subunit SecE